MTIWQCVDHLKDVGCLSRGRNLIFALRQKILKYASGSTKRILMPVYLLWHLDTPTFHVDEL
jgi:hypothetical protein